MGELRTPVLAKLFVGMIVSDPNKLPLFIAALVKRYGAVDFTSEMVRFDRTEYYTEEMGTILYKQFVSFETLISQDDIAKIKNETNELELNDLAEGEGRLVNLDPGYVTAAKVVLATTKDYSHRLYVGQNMYAEITLSFKGGAAVGHPWTYPDYLKQEYTDFFERVRVIYMRQVKN